MWNQIQISHDAEFTVMTGAHWNWPRKNQNAPLKVSKPNSGLFWSQFCPILTYVSYFLSYVVKTRKWSLQSAV